MLTTRGGDECRLDGHVGHAVHRHSCSAIVNVNVDGGFVWLHDCERYRLVTQRYGCGALHNAMLRIA
jgi:hypothetical protein